MNCTLDGSTVMTMAVLSRGLMDIDQGSPEGYTPLVIAAHYGYSRVVRIIVNQRANPSIVDDEGYTALHVAVGEKHLAVTELLVKAGKSLDVAASTGGLTSLHAAVSNGHSTVMRVLIEAGADPNSRALDGSTPLLYESHRKALVVICHVNLVLFARILLLWLCRSQNCPAAH